jgi:uncharacterized protein YbjT (DUF2867 family)
MNEFEKDLTLVLGGTGKTGRRVVERLRALDRPVRVGSRSADPRFDWEDRSTWAPAVRGARAAYISFYPDVAVEGAAETVGAFAQIAVDAGVRRLVLLSGRGEQEAERAEQVVRAVDPTVTIVRATWFAQNFSEGYMLDDVLAGVVTLPVDGMPEPFVDVDDIADVAVAALTEDGHEGEVYEVTGPRALTFAEAVAEIAAASGRPVRFEQCSASEYAAELTRQGVPQEVVALLGYIFGEVLDGRNAQPTDGVSRALGRPPRDFRDFARDAAAAGAWRAAA